MLAGSRVSVLVKTRVSGVESLVVDTSGSVMLVGGEVVVDSVVRVLGALLVAVGAAGLSPDGDGTVLRPHALANPVKLPP